jgi:hypothetical protein
MEILIHFDVIQYRTTVIHKTLTFDWFSHFNSHNKDSCLVKLTVFSIPETHFESLANGPVLLPGVPVWGLVPRIFDSNKHHKSSAVKLTGFELIFLGGFQQTPKLGFGEPHQVTGHPNPGILRNQFQTFSWDTLGVPYDGLPMVIKRSFQIIHKKPGANEIQKAVLSRLTEIIDLPIIFQDWVGINRIPGHPLLRI